MARVWAEVRVAVGGAQWRKTQVQKKMTRHSRMNIMTAHVKGGCQLLARN